MQLSETVRLRPRDLRLFSQYVLFACIAAAVNIGAQALVLLVYAGAFRLTSAMAVGTVAGLLPKYLLDARWIFGARTGGLRQHARDLPLYTITSVCTTFIFWGFEYLFDGLGGGQWHYVGAVVGLAIGYRVKYSLDRDYVFGERV